MSMNIAERQPLLRRTYSRPHSRHSLSPLNVIPTASNSNVDRRSLCRIRTASVTILLCVVFERIAFYALTGNLVLFLNMYPLQWASYHAIDASLYFTGISFATSLIGGWLADSFLGRFKAILVSFIVYIIGYCVMPLISPQDWNLNMTSTKSASLIPFEFPGCNLKNVSDTRSNVDRGPFAENCAWLIFVILSVIGIGTGCVKANIAPFGSDQVAGEGQQATLSFFNWFYWSINLGAFIGLSVIAYVEQEVSFFYGYVSAVSCLAIAILVFIAGRFFFFCRPPEGSVLSNIFRIIHEAWKKKRQRSRTKNVPTNDRDCVVDEAEPANRNLSFLDYAKHRHGGIFHDVLVDSVKQLKKIIIVFIALIPYWIVYFQMQTSFMIQGLHMRLMINLPENLIVKAHNCTSAPEITLNPPTHSHQVAAAWFSLSDVIMLIILLPLFDRIIYPKLEKRYGPVRMSCRILVGMFFSIAAMIVAGVVEHFRLQKYWPDDLHPCLSYSISQQIGNTVYYAADLSVFWQIPQYALIGVSEVFTSVAGLQFAVSMAPRSMKGIIMGLFYLFSGIGSLLGTAIISALSATETWFYPDDFGNINCRRCSQPINDTCEDLQQCRLDYYFYLLAAIELVGVVLFIVVARSLHLDHLHHHAVTAKKLGNASDSFLDPPSGSSSERDFVHSIQRQPSEES